MTPPLTQSKASSIAIFMVKTKINKSQKKPSKKLVKKVSNNNKQKSSLLKSLSNLKLGETAGGALGNLALPGIGGSIGSMLGKGADSIFSSITGSGAYEIQSNSLLGNSNVPSFGEYNRVPFKHREFLTNVVSSDVFSLQKFKINPLSNATFQWLSTISPAFQEYKLKGAIFEYKTLSGSVSTNPALGSVIMSCQYDPYQEDPLDKATMENTEGGISVVPSENAILPIECAGGQTVMEHLYIQNSASGDLRMSIFGNMYLATVGQATAFNGSVLGELWVSYDIEFYKKIPNPLLTKAVNYDDTQDGTKVLFGITRTLNSGIDNLNSYVTSANVVTFPNVGKTYYWKVISYVNLSAVVSTTAPAGSATGAVTILNENMALNGAGTQVIIIIDLLVKGAGTYTYATAANYTPSVGAGRFSLFESPFLL